MEQSVNISVNEMLLNTSDNASFQLFFSLLKKANDITTFEILSDRYAETLCPVLMNNNPGCQFINFIGFDIYVAVNDKFFKSYCVYDN